ncbi:hypothetical protein M501DRAFT_69243 [Patellaria atrata CBS 101060]|uniref:Amine oxidase domain-containing protein n=1 Tax=Patellaria atrata CBS 101060 TaxID=1346257 RepID=A0A9P4SJ45_9PEZI|nr:hypothetical protein M501DRAFT_69243 [Patellaria atrata CBS 101060]
MTSGRSLRSEYARRIMVDATLEEYHRRYPDRNIKQLPMKTIGEPPEANGVEGQMEDSSLPPGRVHIVGAGIAGMFLAMHSLELGFTDFDIFEASSRVGGRVYTHTFEGVNTTHNYYDAGAIRIPDMAAIESFHLQNTLNSRHKPNMYWYSPKTSREIGKELEPFEDEAKRFIEAAQKSDWSKLMEKDNISTRQYLYNRDIESANITGYKTFDTATGLFDQAFTETILHYNDFRAAADKPWHRLDGGMETLT